MSIGNSGNTGGGEVGNLLVQGFKAAKENHRDEAYNIFCEVVRRDPNNELGWLYRAATTDDLSEAYVCLQRVLNINPGNEKAQRGIERIQARLNSEEADGAVAATENSPSTPGRTSPPAQFGSAEVVSGFAPNRFSTSGDNPTEQFNRGIYPAPPANEQGASRYSYDENSVGAYNRASQIPDVPASTPPPYRPEFNTALPFGNPPPAPSETAASFEQPSFYGENNYDNTNQYQEPAYNPGQDEMVDEPLAVGGASTQNRPKERLKSGRGGGNPRIGSTDTSTATGRRVGGGLSPVFGRLAQTRNRGKAAFGAGSTNTGLDSVGKERSQRLMRLLIPIGAVLAVVAIILLVFTLLRSNSNSNNPVAANPTEAAGGTVAGDTPVASAVPASTPIVTVAPTSGNGVPVPVIGITTPANTTAAPVVVPKTTAPPAGQANPTAAPAPQVAPTPTPGAAAPPAGAGGSPKPVVYTVKNGDNLTRIASQFTTTIDAIKAANKTLNSRGDVFVGNQLIIPVSRGGYRGQGGFILKQGETLQALADRYKVSLDDIVKLNGFNGPDEAKVGDPVLIP